MCRWGWVIACCLLACSSKGGHAPIPPDALACSNDGTCPPGTPYCDTKLGYCVQCVGDANCGTNRVCSANDTCVTCTSDSQCSAPTAHCSAAGACVMCTDTTQCTAGQQCNTNTNKCVAGCGSNGDCGSAAPICNTAQMYCVDCLQSSDCSGSTPACDTTDNTCVGCLQDTDCTNAPKLKCSPNQTCVQCIVNADCPMGHSCSFGTCR